MNFNPDLKKKKKNQSKQQTLTELKKKNSIKRRISVHFRNQAR